MTYKLEPAAARNRVIAALRSGEYAEADESIRGAYMSSEDGWSAYGVICDLFIKSEGVGEWVPGAEWAEGIDEFEHYCFIGPGMRAPERVELPDFLAFDWLGMSLMGFEVFEWAEGDHADFKQLSRILELGGLQSMAEAS